MSAVFRCIEDNVKAVCGRSFFDYAEDGVGVFGNRVINRLK